MTRGRRGGKPFNPAPPERAIAIVQKQASISLISRMGGSGVMRSTAFGCQPDRIDPVGCAIRSVLNSLSWSQPARGLPWIGQWHNPNAGWSGAPPASRKT
jgi:hypothetical protein